MDETKTEKSKNNMIGHMLIVITGLMISLFIVSLDSTITSTAMPKIIADLGGLQYYVWPFTIYLTTLIISTMLSGKLSDFYGSKKVLVVGILVFVLGSVLCGLSHNMTELILFRGLQGLGGGILIALPLKIVAEMFPSRQRGKYIGIFGAAGAISSVVGPVLGGFITDMFGWQWIFFVNVPIGIVAISIILVYFPDLAPTVKERIIDYVGIITFIAGLISLLLALTFIQQNTGVSTLLLAFLFIFAAIMMFVFIYAEINAHEPVLPMYLFKNSIYSISAVVVLLLGAIMFSAAVYIPLFLQGVQGLSAAASGALLTPLMLSMIVASVLAGQIISRTGTYRKLGIAAFIIGTIGMWLLSTMNTGTTQTDVIIYASVLGVGMGLATPVFTLASQNAVKKQDLGVVTASIQYFRLLGSVVSLAVLGAVVNSTLKINLQNTHAALQPALLTTAIHNVFLIGIALSLVGLIITLFLKELTMSNEIEEDVT